MNQNVNMKKPEEIEIPLFDEILGNAKKDSILFVENSLAIANQILQSLDNKGWNQKELADKMGKSEAEISKWLSGFHNFTIRSISKIEAVLGEKIIYTHSRFKEEFFVDFQLSDIYNTNLDNYNMNNKISGINLKFSNDFNSSLDVLLAEEVVSSVSNLKNVA